jgi:hypothetical protein
MDKDTIGPVLLAVGKGWKRYGFPDKASRAGERAAAEAAGCTTSHGTSMNSDGSLCYWLKVYGAQNA